MRVVLEEFRLAGRVEESGGKFREQGEYSLYQSSSKIAKLKEIVNEMGDSVSKNKVTVVGETLFYHHDLYEQKMRTLYHRLKGCLIKRAYRKELKRKYFIKKRP